MPTCESRSRRLVRWIGRVSRRLVHRLYALGLITLIVWLTWRAFAYLWISLAVPAKVPRQITDLPIRMDRRILTSAPAEWEAIGVAPHPRSPLAHYHQLNAWIQGDPMNGCTTSGCHSPLPHARRKADRAFLNMHATSLHCGVCHIASDRQPLEVAWYDLETGETTDPPAVLTAFNVLTTWDAPGVAASDGDRKLVLGLLRRAVKESRGHPELQTLHNHFRAAPADSPFDRDLVRLALDTFPRHARGEYGSKLALLDPSTGRSMLTHPGSERAVEAYLQRSADAGMAERAGLIARVHTKRRIDPLPCHACHVQPGGRIDFVAAGYPASRADDLTGTIVASMVEHIASGRPFYLPGFVGEEAPP